MDLSPKVRVLNFFRNIFKISFLERFLASQTRGKSPDHFVCKLVPSPYQYIPNSLRTFNRNGITMKIDISDYIGHYLYFGFKDDEIETLFNLCKEGSNVLDIGTNIGWVAHNLAQLSKTGLVYGFEPDPFNYDRCAENISLNNLKNLIVFPIGLGADQANLGMQVRTPSNLGGNRITPSGTSSTRMVEIKKLDDVEMVQQLSKIHLVKIDVEGYELKVLRGGEQTLKKHHPILFIELDDNNLKDQGDSALDLIRFLLALGYTSISRADTKEEVSICTNFGNTHFDIIVR